MTKAKSKQIIPSVSKIGSLILLNHSINNRTNKISSHLQAMKNELTWITSTRYVHSLLIYHQNANSFVKFCKQKSIHYHLKIRYLMLCSSIITLPEQTNSVDFKHPSPHQLPTFLLCFDSCFEFKKNKRNCRRCL